MLRSSRTLAIAITLSTLYSLGIGLLGPIYPIFVVNRFSASIVDLGILYAIFCLVTAVFKVLAGRLAGAHGIERIFFVGVMMGAMCPLGYVYAPSILHRYIIEFFFGVAHALQRPSLLALMVDLSEKIEKAQF